METQQRQPSIKIFSDLTTWRVLLDEQEVGLERSTSLTFRGKTPFSMTVLAATQGYLDEGQCHINDLEVDKEYDFALVNELGERKHEGRVWLANRQNFGFFGKADHAILHLFWLEPEPTTDNPQLTTT